MAAKLYDPIVPLGARQQIKRQPDVLEDVLGLLATATAVCSDGRLDLIANIAERYDGTVDRL